VGEAQFGMGVAGRGFRTFLQFWHGLIPSKR
jgi:hypothetical protein